MDRRPATLLAAVVAVALLCPAGRVAVAQDVHRCVTADGRVNYTDQVCSDIGAIEKKPAAAPSGNVQIHIRDCARSTDDLLFGVRAALEARDVNKLAAFYHWAGIGTDESVRLMDQLEKISQRPLLDATLEGFSVPVEPTPASLPETSSRRALPDRLHIEQMKSEDSIASISTTFQLQRNLGCWWIRY